MPHGLKIDSEGNIWITDVGRHQVNLRSCLFNFSLILFIFMKTRY
jgi:hypothetical protein